MVTLVETKIAGKIYKGKVIGIRQDVQQLFHYNNIYEIIPTHWYCEITFGKDIIEIPIDEQQFRKIAKQF